MFSLQYETIFNTEKDFRGGICLWAAKISSMQYEMSLGRNKVFVTV